MGDSSPGEQRAESYCPHCERSFAPDSQVCPDDGTTLVQFGSQREQLVGKVLAGRFEITARLGAGGMGAVYCAKQTSVGREVAVKIIDPVLSQDREASKRFLREAKLASRLSQPNTVVVHDFGQDQGMLFIVMELLRGVTLRELLKESGALPAARVRRIGVQLCDALEAAHAMGVIHRDLKPANIMILSQPAGRDVVKVLDFGLAKSLIGDNTSTSITQSGAVMGTPLYMAPEMIHGQPADQRADLYALGCILHEMAAGAPPFVGPTTSALFAKHLTESPRRLDRPDLGAAQVMIGRMLAKEAPQRPASAAEVRAALLDERASSQGAPTPAPRSGALSTAPTLTAASAGAAAARAVSDARPVRWPYAAVAVAAAAVVGFLVWRGASRDSAPPAPAPAPVAAAQPADAAPARAQPTLVPVDAAPAAEATVRFESSPAADVYLGDERIGRTPIEQTLAPGVELEVTFRRSGYGSVRRNVTATEGLVVTATLNRRRTRPATAPGPKPGVDDPPDVDFIKPKKK